MAVPSAPPGITNPVAMGRDPTVLAVIGQAQTGMAIWQRSHVGPMADLTRGLRALSAEAMPHGRFISTLDGIKPALDGCYDHHTTEPKISLLRQALADDVQQLATIFQSITRSPYLDIRIQHMRHDACRYWHLDNVAYRLICTYFGPGTQWVDPAKNQEVLAKRDRWEGHCETMEAGDVSVFAGACAQQKAGIVHRSPPIKAAGESRLVLCINTASAPA